MSSSAPSDTMVTYQASPSVAIHVKPQPARPRPAPLPPHKLLLHNDKVNTMEDVVEAILKLTPLRPIDAIRRMLEAHYRGKALLLTVHKERGELYIEQFATFKITTSLESDA